MGLLQAFKLQRDELDKRLGGGIPTGSLILIDGDHGSGKSVLLQRMVYGFLEKGHSVTFLSSQFTTRDFISQMYSLNYPILPSLAANKLLFISIYPLISESKRGDFFFRKLMETRDLYRNEILVVDALSSLIKYNKDNQKLSDLIAFFKRITGTGKTIALTVNTEDLTPDATEILRSSAHIYITTKRKAIGDSIKLSIVVNKYLSAQNPYTTVTNFRIVPKIGFVIEISSVA
ncbi:MAG: ATPase domain-containing protein [Candidatus Micrarchaeota archaeon]